MYDKNEPDYKDVFTLKSLAFCSLPQTGKLSHQQTLSIVDTAFDPGASLKRICDLVAAGERPYEDFAEQIEDRAYELCEAGNLDQVVAELNRITFFFESLTDKNDEQCRDLADVYLLIGQIYQFSGCFIESIQWFVRSAVVDDRYAAPYHNMAASYSQLQQFDNAIKCFEQELMLAPGNYYSYLLLADLYKKEKCLKEVETCLKHLLERDVENIQGLHALIRHYEQTDQSIDTKLLVRRLMGINKQFSRIEVIIRSYYLCRDKKYTEALDFIEKWNQYGNVTTIIDLIKAHAYNELRQCKKRRQTLVAFKMQNHCREDLMLNKLKEFRTLFGDDIADHLQKLLLISPPKADNTAAV
jgi:tetratricopeptide (TPR) repeat protein